MSASSENPVSTRWERGQFSAPLSANRHAIELKVDKPAYPRRRRRQRQRLWAAFARPRRSGIAKTKHLVPYRRSGQRASGELCPWRSRARRNWLRRVASRPRPGLARALAAIPWRRIPKKMQAPITGVARRTSSPNAVATHPRLRCTIPYGDLVEVGSISTSRSVVPPRSARHQHLW